MKKKMSIWSIICCTGLPWLVIFITGGVYAVRKYDLRMDDKTVMLIAGLGWFLILLKNLMFLNTSKKIGLFTWLEKCNNEPPAVSVRKKKAQYPDITPELLSDQPDGLVLGKKGKKYVRVPLRKGNILNAVLMGAPGCGKSVLLLTMLLYQIHHKPSPKEKEAGWERMTFFVLDIKPELCRKSVKIRGNKRVHMMNPEDRKSYGWDPYYNLDANSSDDEVMSELELICRALVDAGKSEKNEFFYASARNIMQGVLFYTYRQGRSFMQGLDYLLDGSLEEVLKKTLEMSEGKMEYKVVRELLKPYAGKTGEAIQSVEMTLRQNLSIFTKQATRFFLDGNPKKASPLDLEEKISVFFSIPETKIDEYKTLMRLVTMQIMQHCSGRSESAHMLTLIIDEAARLGSINWVSFLSTSRSRQCVTILAFQSLTQMQTVWSKEEAKSLIELCRVIAVLSCTDMDTAQMLSGWAGEYKDSKESYNLGNKQNEGSYSQSFEDKKILQPADIMTLQETGEVILFIKGKYYRTSVEGARYYNIKELNEISQKCLAANEEKGV